MKVYYVEVVGENKLNMLCVDMNQRHKIWTQHPTAIEISKKEYYEMKDEINKKKEASNAV